MSTEIGKQAERRVAEYLKLKGYTIRTLNWRTRSCEIDIIAEKKGIIWCIEVKYRRSTRQGHGYEYVTPKKLQQMEYAARVWVQEHGWSGDYRLAVASVDDVTITFIDEL